MNEIEKLYENAESNRDCNLYKHFTECPMKHTQCEDCENFGYPSFTEKKQLELIKLFAHKAHNGLLINKHITNGGASMVFDNLGYESTLASSPISFEECIAKLVNYLWQSLTEEEKEQIREILNG